MLPCRVKKLCEVSTSFALAALIVLPLAAGIATGSLYPLPFPTDPSIAPYVGLAAASIALVASLPCYLWARIHASFVWAVPRFLRGVASSVRSGMPLHQAIEEVAKTGIYGALGKLMLRAITRMRLGIDFDRTMAIAAREAADPIIDRLTALLVEANEAGPLASKVLDASSEFFSVVEEFMLLREAHTRPYFVIVYMLVAVYLFIVYIIVNVMLPAFSGLKLPLTITVSPEEMAILFYWQSFVSSIAAGVFLGKITYNNSRAGLFHASILAIMTSLFFALAIFGKAITIPMGAMPAPNVTGGG